MNKTAVATMSTPTTKLDISDWAPDKPSIQDSHLVIIVNDTQYHIHLMILMTNTKADSNGNGS